MKSIVWVPLKDGMNFWSQPFLIVPLVLKTVSSLPLVSSFTGIRRLNEAFVLHWFILTVVIGRHLAHAAGVGAIFDRVLTELVSKMREMKLDMAELGCLRAIILFNPGN